MTVNKEMVANDVVHYPRLWWRRFGSGARGGRDVRAVGVATTRQLQRKKKFRKKAKDRRKK